MKMKKRRILSMLLALIMIFNSIPMPHINAYADTLGEAVCDCGYEEYKQSGVGETSPSDAYMSGHTPECAINNVEPDEPICECEGEHVVGCEYYATPTCEECGAEGDTHNTECSLYEGPKCNCNTEDGTHYATCVFYTCPDCGDAGWHEVCPESKDENTGNTEPNPDGESDSEKEPEPSLDFSGDVGKYAEFSEDAGIYTVCEGRKFTDSNAQLVMYYEDFEEDTVVEITDWYWNEETTELWYLVEFISGGVIADAEEYWPEEPWVLQGYTEDDDSEKSLEFVTFEEDFELCDICGKANCHALHFYCTRCEEYDCGESHLYCNICEKYDCDVEHVYCSNCGDYDCGLEHEDEDFYKPATTPIIPDEPTHTDGEDVSIVDEYGDPVTEDGLYLFEGMKSSISAWSELEDAQESEPTYQWQIRIDRTEETWVDIQGQTEKGLLVSPAMFSSILEEQESVGVRCVVTCGDESQTSKEIPVVVIEQEPMSMFALKNLPVDMSEETTPDDLTKSYVVVQYVYSDGRTAASTAFAEIIPGSAYKNNYTLPEIPGYKATLKNASSFGTNVNISGGVLSVDYAEGELTEEYTIITVEYEPDYVKYTVIHYWQNVDNDNYTEHERETITTEHKTGEMIDDAENAYPGFYNLLYETPTAAADGSTVIEVYYDRYYYLMKFELDGGYGVYPIYARYGADVEIGTPTKKGYRFKGWVDVSENPITIPSSVPVNGGTYYADWEPVDTEYTVAYWINNDDGTKTYIGSKVVGANSGDEVSGNGDLTIETNACGMPEHTHDSCTMTCTLSEHSHGDGMCIYDCGETFHDHTSGCTYNTCKKEVHTTHTRDCYEFTSTNVGSESINLRYSYHETTKNGFDIYWAISDTYQGGYYVKIGDSYYLINNYNDNTSLAYTLKCHVHSGVCCDVEYHDHSECTCIVVPHMHNVNCYDCGAIVHTHSAECKSDLAKYVDFVRGDQKVVVKGDGSTVVNEYYEYRTYTIRFVYAKANGSAYQVANSTGAGILDKCSWTNVWADLPTFVDPSGKIERSSFTVTEGTGGTDGSTIYYYISLSAKFGADISSLWPSANMGNAGSYEWGSWAAAAGTGYRIKYGDAHANIVGPYPVMSADMIVDNPELLADGTYLAQNMIAWWASSSDNVDYHAYHNYFELLPSEDNTGAVLYNGKYYKLVETYTFTAAHNGNTRVDPIYFNGYKCINDSRDTDEDTQANSKDFENKGTCTICGTTCDYCNSFYYDRSMHKLYFWNYNGSLRDGPGSDVAYGASLSQHGAFVDAEFMSQPENYPDGLEPGAYEFAGWYTTDDCHDGTEMNWNTTMPDSDMTVYAKWVPISHTVNYFLTQDSLTRGENIPTEMARLVQEAINAGKITVAPTTDPYTLIFKTVSVEHGSYIGALADPEVSDGYEKIHPRAGYEFVGWFYLNEAGEETAFDPVNMPVRQNLNLYAKWSTNTLCQYNVYFALDSNSDGIADLDASGNTIYIANSISGSAIAGHTYTFTAKGGDDLYAGYQEGYFPNTGSHSITIDIADVSGTGANSYVFLYQQKESVPYTVKYINTETNTSVFGDTTVSNKEVSDNKNVVVTENFVYIQGYMPDAYQKTLVVSSADGAVNEIIFYYTKDEKHALYVINHYIQELNSDLSHKGWSKHTDLQNTGEIGTTYSAEALQIDGFTLSKSETDRYNVTLKENGMENTDLPAVVSQLSEDNKLSGTLVDTGMELNFYYTRNLYPYEFRYVLQGTSTPLADPVVGKAGFDTTVTGVAKTITKDIDGDGVNEDYRLYDPTETTKDIHINTDGNPLSASSTVVAGQAKINISTFEYVRCTQSMTITKTVTDSSVSSNPDPDQEFGFKLLIHATSGYHKTSYKFEKYYGTSGTENTTGEISRSVSASNTLQFTLKAGQTIKIDGLPTAEYTISEINLPTGYYENTITPAARNTLTVDSQVDVVVNNIYDPADLTISKTVEVVEEYTNTPEVENFNFSITFPTESTPESSYSYTVSGETGTKNVTVSDGKMSVQLKKGQTATFHNLPIGAYTVTEDDYSASGYDSNYSINSGTEARERTALVTLARGTTQDVDFINKFPVGDLVIEKTVTKEFARTPWNGDTFEFTVKRTNKDLIAGNQYKVLVNGLPSSTPAIVGDDKLIHVELTFDAQAAATMSQTKADIVRTLQIVNLPAGTYQVTEAVDSDYVQTSSAGNLVIPADKVIAKFTNEIPRPNGNLILRKELKNEEGYNGELPEGVMFEFTIELTEDAPEGSRKFTVKFDPQVYTTVGTDGVKTTTTAPTSVTMEDGKFTIQIQAGQSVEIDNLPIGIYKITEASVPQYANKFAVLNGSAYVDQENQKENGNLFTTVDITKESTVDVKCTNIYPVDTAELIIQKKVTQASNKVTLPENQVFTFTVTLKDEKTENYSYKIYNSKGVAVSSGVQTIEAVAGVFSVNLADGQYVVIEDVPVCDYTIVESSESSTTSMADYTVSYQTYTSDTKGNTSTSVNSNAALQTFHAGNIMNSTFVAGKTDAVIFTNLYHYGTLTITNDITGELPANENQTFIFHISGNGVEMDVTVSGEGSVTVYDLPLGTYTVTEKSEWSWRYNSDSTSQTTEITTSTPDSKVDFTHSYGENKWLNFFTNKLNQFSLFSAN